MFDQFVGGASKAWGGSFMGFKDDGVEFFFGKVRGDCFEGFGGILEIVSGGIDRRKSGIVLGFVVVDLAFLVKKDLKNWLA